MTVNVENPASISAAAAAMATGGDARIRLDPATGLNRYFSAPVPSRVLAYASSTANDISAMAFARAERLFSEIGGGLSGPSYSDRLEQLRKRLRDVYQIDEEVDVVFAPSGTDLEYVALAATAGRGSGTHVILLGADEVGTGCIHSAHGNYFAESTALGISTQIGQPVPGMGGIEVDLVDIPVRDPDGRVRPSAEIAERMETLLEAAKSAGRHSLIHVVHGSKTGLILPGKDELDNLQAGHGETSTLVVDACQARITSAAINNYLDRGAIVFVTGSKFMGGPPFSGFAFVPPAVAHKAVPLADGLATIFRRGEWPQGWPGAEKLPDSSNVGLLLRLEASIYELERFQNLAPQAAERVILAFHAAVRSEIIDLTPAHRLAPYPPGDREEADTHPIEMRTLSTLDLSEMRGGSTFEDAQAWHKALLGHEVRLGQPVKCVRLADGRWGATLRIGLAMWQIVDRAELAEAELAESFRRDMARIRNALHSVAG